MKVLQFAFGGGDNEYLPCNHIKNCVVYPGTHDNTTLTDWWETVATKKEKRNAAAYLHLTAHLKPTAGPGRGGQARPGPAGADPGRPQLPGRPGLIPLYDWLGLGAEAHLNTPGRLGGNWAWRARKGFDTAVLAGQIRQECEVSCRTRENLLAE